MDTAHLKAFLRIAETGSISRAADSLGIAQPSLSQQLLRLEDEIAVRLFDRTARGVVLTEAGLVFRECARTILHAAEQAVADARHLRDEAPGQVVLAMPPSVARMIGAPLVEALADAGGAVRVRVVEAHSGTIRGWIEAEKIDLGIVYDLARLPHLAQRPLLSEALAIAGAPGRFGAGAAMGFAAFARGPVLAPGPQHGLRQLLEREAARRGLALEVAAEIDAPDSLIALAGRGRGLAAVPACLAGEALRAGRISAAGFEPPLRRRLSVLRNPAHVLTHASVRVEHAVRAVVAELIAGGAWEAEIEDGDGGD